MLLLFCLQKLCLSDVFVLSTALPQPTHDSRADCAHITRFAVGLVMQKGTNSFSARQRQYLRSDLREKAVLAQAATQNQGYS